ncbi:MAG: nitroreductase family protein [bacterium]|nr:nitroreductase family protein [bacterium]
MIRDLILKNRSYRRFDEADPIDEATMRELVDLARLSMSGGNLQPLKYMVSCTPERNALVFPHTVWAGYLTDWPGPAEGERPSGYVIILGDKEIRAGFDTDCGIAAENICLGAAEKGLGCCMIGSIRREKLRKALQISEEYEILLIIAMGTPKETVTLETVGDDGKIEYWRDDSGTHHVPKRTLDDVLID